MSTTHDLSTALHPVRAAEDVDGRCAACVHDLAGHDRISRRYCDATKSQALSRNCICPAP